MRWNQFLNQILMGLTTLIMALALGCSDQNSMSLPKSSTPQAQTPAVLNPATSPNALGGGSDGGGNLIKGKPIEDWARTISSDRGFRKAYKKELEKIIAKIRNRPDTENDSRGKVLANFLQSTLQEKTWYFVPGPLSSVPQSLTGSVVTTSQGALQSQDRVWVDLDLWNNMNNETRATLVLHEAVMGLKILQFQSERLQCEWAYLQKSPTCSETLGTETRTIQLSAKDYKDVQQNVLTLKRYLSGSQDLDLLFWFNLDDNFKYAFPWFDQTVEITRSQFSNMLDGSSRSHELPIFGLNLEKKTLTSCQWKMSFGDGKHLNLELSTSEGQLKLASEIPDRWNASRREVFGDTGRIVFLSTQPEKTDSGDFKFYFMEFVLSTDTWQGFYIEEESCANKDCRDVSPVSIKDGLHLYCSKSPLEKFAK